MIPILLVLCGHDLARRNTKPIVGILEIWSSYLILINCKFLVKLNGVKNT